MSDDVDLNRLPVPDWDIFCPRCKYALRFLPQHRCPECGCEFSMEEVVPTWVRVREPRFRGDELPLPDFGMKCGACGGELAGAATRACPHCGEPFDLSQRPPRQAWFYLDADMFGKLQLSIVEHLLESERIPFMLIDSKTFGEIYAGGQSLGRKVVASTEFYFDVLHILRSTQIEIEAKRQAGEGADWRCSSCGEEVPGHFDVCWNCQATRPEP